jgi:hypothetical protein
LSTSPPPPPLKDVPEGPPGHSAAESLLKPLAAYGLSIVNCESETTLKLCSKCYCAVTNTIGATGLHGGEGLDKSEKVRLFAAEFLLRTVVVHVITLARQLSVARILSSTLRTLGPALGLVLGVAGFNSRARLRATRDVLFEPGGFTVPAEAAAAAARAAGRSLNQYHESPPAYSSRDSSKSLGQSEAAFLSLSGGWRRHCWV